MDRSHTSHVHRWYIFWTKGIHRCFTPKRDGPGATANGSAPQFCKVRAKSRTRTGAKKHQRRCPQIHRPQSRSRESLQFPRRAAVTCPPWVGKYAAWNRGACGQRRSDKPPLRAGTSLVGLKGAPTKGRRGRVHGSRAQRARRSEAKRSSAGERRTNGVHCPPGAPLQNWFRP